MKSVWRSRVNSGYPPMTRRITKFASDSAEKKAEEQKAEEQKANDKKKK